MFSRGPFSGKNQVYRDTANNFLNSLLSPTSSPAPERREQVQPTSYSPTYSPTYSRTKNVTNNYNSPTVERIVERVVVVERESPKPTPQMTHTERLQLERGSTLQSPPTPVLSPQIQGKTIDGVLHPSGCFCSGCKPAPMSPTSISRSASHELPPSPKLTPIKRAQSENVTDEPTFARMDTPMPIRKEGKEEEREVDRLAREALERKVEQMEAQRERETKELNDLKAMYANVQQRLEMDAKLKNDKREQKESDKKELIRKQEIEQQELLKKEIAQKEAIKTKHEKEIDRNKAIYKRLGAATAKNAVQRYYDKFGMNPGSDEPVPKELLERVEQDVLSKSAYANFGSNPNSRTNSPAVSRSNSEAVKESFGTGGNIGSSPSVQTRNLSVDDFHALDLNSEERSGSPEIKK